MKPGEKTKLKQERSSCSREYVTAPFYLPGYIMLNYGHRFVSEEEEAQTEAGCFRPLRGSRGEGDCGPCAGATTSGGEEKEGANSQSWHGNCD